MKKMCFQAYQYSNTIVLCLVLALLLTMLQVKGATHIVGDKDGWSLFTVDSNWTQGKEFHVGDVLVFNYEEEEHNVMQVNSTAFEDCIKVPYISLFASGSDSMLLTEVGKSWYICGVGEHCENGQKLSIDVVP